MQYRIALYNGSPILVRLPVDRRATDVTRPSANRDNAMLDQYSLPFVYIVPGGRFP